MHNEFIFLRESKIRKNPNIVLLKKNLKCYMCVISNHLLIDEGKVYVSCQIVRIARISKC